ncbi:MAG: hypothetical protein HZA53_15700 [Planctomycetes bacterium]|nr:hypothetical protein [Planctomycetota bacterium]
MKSKPTRDRFAAVHGPRSMALGALASLCACAQLGPRSIQTDRFDYSTAVAESWKQQTLLNIVKLRYMDLPVFVDVASVVAGYSMETTGSVGALLRTGGSNSTDDLTLGAAGKFTDRPTITYVPMTGEKFLRGLIVPIDPKVIFSMLQSGYPADFILGLTVESISGVRNRSTAGGVAREADPEFARVLELLRGVQAAGAFGMRVEEDKANGSVGVVFFRKEDVQPEVEEQIAEILRLLHLPARTPRFTLKYSPLRGAEGELAVNSRSMLQIMTAFSSYMEVPQEHLDDHSASPAFEQSAPGFTRGGFRIHSGEDEPKGAYAAVRYREHWYWIDQGDWGTKRAMTAIIFFFTMAESGGNDQVPLITIPAQ